jgi:hypothetical protein
MLKTHWHIRIQVSPPVPGLKHCFGFLIVLHLHRAPQIFWTFFATFGATPHFRTISSSNPSWTNWWKRSEVLCQSAGAWLVRVPKGIQPAGTCEQRLEAAVTKRSRPRIPRKNQSPGEVVRCPALRSLLPRTPYDLTMDSDDNKDRLLWEGLGQLRQYLHWTRKKIGTGRYCAAGVSQSS